ncbi:MAG TPA: glycosyl hydrolase family 28 protein [Edaphobacter sp.]|uniref:glycoside hydrolase family 28 protein n=1 Tax=Edaphobacter sp. TaxID=1934404 RepID=UPI002BDC8D92|nr:glycosyl hydrolase family 28 protein [Edaphobacter sp.]HUZ94787.1 glycosyl hydrolase family 28 protein [Edaphobacter sp.]
MASHLFERRSFLKKAGQSLLAVPALSAMGAVAEMPGKHGGKARGWDGSPFAYTPKVTLNVRDYGATGDGKTNDRVALQETIDRCGVFGGGEVVVPAGDYVTGALALRSDVVLRLEKDATLLGTPDFDDYPVTQVRWEGRWIQGHIALIYAIDASRIGIVGSGKIVGNPALGGRPRKETPLRHPALIEFIECRDIRLEDFSTSNHLMWSIHPTNCENIFIKGLTIRSTGGNGDGIDIDSSKHVVIDGCDIATGDDCISLKSGRGAEGYALLRTTEDVLIKNCTFADSIFACIGIGSETSGGIRDVRIEHCKFTRAKTFAIYIKSRPGRGAFIENIVANDLDASDMTGGFLRFNILNSGIRDEFQVPGDEGIPTIRNFRFSNIRVKECPILVEGTGIHPHKPLEGFSLVNVSGTCEKGIYLANVKDAVIRNVSVTGFAGPLLNLSNVTGKGLVGATTIASPPMGEPVPTPSQPYRLH